jgi:DNA polymerase-3 subunit epsilon
MFLFYDVETSGLYHDGLPPDHESQPRIVQLAALLTTLNGETRGAVNFLVQQDAPIPADAVAIHGISDARCAEYGVPELVALAAFNGLAAQAVTAIGWNQAFDRRIIRAAFARNQRPCRLPDHQVEPMLMARDLVNLAPNFPGGTPRWPKLVEAYQFFFGEELENAHDAMVDVLATCRIWLELKRRGIKDEAPPRDKNATPSSSWSKTGVVGRTHDDFVKIVEAATNGGTGELSDFERSFVADMKTKLDKYGERSLLSDKQWVILERIKEKVGAHAA